MLKRDKNIFYGVITAERFKPEDFEVKETGSTKEDFAVTLRGTPFKFFVRSSPESYSNSTVAILS